MAFPRNAFSEYLGYVTPEDKQRWMQQREEAEAAKAERRTGGVMDKVKKAMGPAMELAERGINAKMHAEYESENDRKNDKAKRITETKQYKITYDDEPQM